MGSMTVSAVTPLYTGASSTATDTGGSTATILIDHTTAQGALDLSKLCVVFENYSSTLSCTVTLNAGAGFSEIGIGGAAALTVATAGTAGFCRVFGGKDFESARFLTAAEKVSFTATTAGTLYIRAFQLP